MDDLAITAKSVPEGISILQDLEELTKLSRMELKIKKSIPEKYVQERYRFITGEETISTIREKPVKSLGKWYGAEINDKESALNDIYVCRPTRR